MTGIFAKHNQKLIVLFYKRSPTHHRILHRAPKSFTFVPNFTTERKKPATFFAFRILTLLLEALRSLVYMCLFTAANFQSPKIHPNCTDSAGYFTFPVAGQRSLPSYQLISNQQLRKTTLFPPKLPPATRNSPYSDTIHKVKEIGNGRPAPLDWQVTSTDSPDRKWRQLHASRSPCSNALPVNFWSDSSSGH